MYNFIGSKKYIGSKKQEQLQLQTAITIRPLSAHLELHLCPFSMTNDVDLPRQ